jgi:hypothetical protein
MKPNTGSVNFGRVSLQFKKSHNTHLCLSEKPKCCRWHPTQAPQILSKDQRRAAPMTKFQSPNKPKNLTTRKKERKKDVPGGGGVWLETKQG